MMESFTQYTRSETNFLAPYFERYTVVRQNYEKTQDLLKNELDEYLKIGVILNQNLIIDKIFGVTVKICDEFSEIEKICKEKIKNSDILKKYSDCFFTLVEIHISEIFQNKIISENWFASVKISASGNPKKYIFCVAKLKNLVPTETFKIVVPVHRQYFSKDTVSLTQKINQLRVPDIVNMKTANSAILDCDYDLETTEGLTVKWFFGDSPVYQWIPEGGRPPQALGILRDRLDLNYKVTNQKYSMHRALNIQNLSLNLTGEYKCVVSTWKREDSQTKKMIVLEPPEEVKIYQYKEDEDSVTVVCSAQEMFPLPILNISYEGSPLLENTAINKSKTDAGLYNVTTSITLKDEILEYPTDFICNLNIPDTPYSQQVTLKYYPGAETTTEYHYQAYLNHNNSESKNLHFTDNGVAVHSVSTWLSVILALILSRLA